MALLDLFQKKDRPGSRDLQQVNLRKIMPYGDLLGDGALQLSFTLPVAASPEAREAARRYVEKLGLKEVHVAHMESQGGGLSFFVVYAQAKHSLDFSKIKVPSADFVSMDYEQIMDYAREHIRDRLVVVGATTGTDAHTVGLDAIMNLKGYRGDYGLERYPFLRTYNLRSQVSNEEFVNRVERLRADVVLVSKVVTQRGKHLEELKQLAAMLNASKKVRVPLIKIVGGPRMTHAQAVKLGFDAGFGPETLPREVASLIVQEYVRLTKKR